MATIEELERRIVHLEEAENAKRAMARVTLSTVFTRQAAAMAVPHGSRPQGHL